jgi:hypothetical protein
VAEPAREEEGELPEPVAEEEAAQEEIASPPEQYEPPPAPPLYEPPPPRVYEPPPVQAYAGSPETYEAPVEEQPVAEPPAAFDSEPTAYDAEPAAYDANAEAPPAVEYVPPPLPIGTAAPADLRAKTGLSPLVLGLGAVVLVLLGVMGWLLMRDSGPNEDVGELVVTSRPEGAQVKIDGEPKGVTPLTIRLDKGAHVLEVQSGKSEPRVIPLMIQGGVQTSQYVELTGTAAVGGLEIVSQPAGARIVIDGQNRGTAPMTIRDLSPGDHTVVLELRGRKVTQTVKIQAGSTSKLSVPIK